MCIDVSMVPVIMETAVNTVNTVKKINDVRTSYKSAEMNVQSSLKQAKNAEINAANEIQQGIEKARNEKLKSILAIGDKKVTSAANNISSNSGTMLNLYEDEEQEAELSALNYIQNSEIKADEYRNKAEAYYDKAELNSLKLTSAKTKLFLEPMEGTMDIFVKHKKKK